MTELDYPAIEAALQRIAVDISPAECHGQLCGLLCSMPDFSYSQWIETALPDVVNAKAGGDALAVETDGLLQQLYRDTESSIQDRDLGFQLLLVDDDDSLSLRLEQLAEWSSGFLLGLAAGGIKDFKGLPGDIPEFLQDMVEISRVGRFELENEEEDENAYVELIEYVRMGVMLVRMELHHLHSDGTNGQVSIH